MSVKINTLELENVKKIKAVQLTPTENGLTVIGGNNRQGKTSVLDAIAWTLGGNRFKPSEPHREGKSATLSGARKQLWTSCAVSTASRATHREGDR